MLPSSSAEGKAAVKATQEYEFKKHTVVVFVPNMLTLNLMKENNQTNPNGGMHHKTTGLGS